MKNTIYMEKYKFSFVREVIDFSNSKNFLNRYNSRFFLENIGKDIGDLEKKYEIFKIVEKNIEIIENGLRITNTENPIYDVFSSLIICLDKNSFFCKILNVEELKYKIKILKNRYEYNIKNIENLEKLEDYETAVNDERLLFGIINENKFVKSLFSSPYYRRFEFSSDGKGFFIVDFLRNVVIPVKIFEKFKENYTEIYGKIDESQMNDFTFRKKLSDLCRFDVKKYIFSYYFKIYFENNRVKKVNEEIILKIEDSLIFSEKINIESYK